MSNKIRGAQLVLTTISISPSQLLNGGTATSGDALVWNTSASQWQPGGALTTQDSGANQLTNIKTVNFQAGLDVIDDGSGQVTINAQNISHSDVSDNGTQVVTSPADINFGAYLNVADDGDGTVTVSVPSTGQDSTLVSGTAGTGNNIAKWNSNGDLIDTGIGTTSLVVTTSSIDALSDVDTTTTAPNDGDVLTWNNANSEWEPFAPQGTGGDVNISNNGTQIVSGTTDINFSSNITAVDDGDGTVTVNVVDNWVDIGGDTLTGTLTSQDIIPEMTGASGSISTRTLGTSSAWFAEAYIDELFVGSNSLYVNDKKVIEDVSDTINITTDVDQSLAIKTTGIGDIDITSEDLIDITADGGLQLTVPSTQATKHLNVTNDSSGGNITFTTTGASSQVQFNAVDQIDLSAPIIDLNGTVQLSADPSTSLEAATKQYVDNQITSHTHALSDLQQSGASDGQVATWNNTAGEWEPQDPSGGGSSIVLDLGDDGTNESTALSEISTTNDANNIFTEPAADKLLIDVSANWPTADTANSLATSALDTIGEIDATVRTGADSTLVTGTAGTSGNLTEWNVDGDLIDSGVATSSVSTTADIDNAVAKMEAFSLFMAV